MENNVDTIIGVNVLIKGNLNNKNSVEINGSVEGEVRSDDHIDVGQTAKISGPVTAKTIVISGQVKGIVEATERLEINPTGVIIGDINAKSLIIQQGATFIGKSIMPSDNVKIPSSNKEDKKEVTTEAAAIKVEKEEKKELDEKDKVDDKEIIEDKFGFFSKK